MTMHPLANYLNLNGPQARPGPVSIGETVKFALLLGRLLLHGWRQGIRRIAAISDITVTPPDWKRRICEVDSENHHRRHNLRPSVQANPGQVVIFSEPHWVVSVNVAHTVHAS